jgi:hypothetical protein
MVEVTKTDKKTGEAKVVKVPSMVGEAIVYGGSCAVMGVIMGFLSGAVRDIKDLLKKDK